MSHSHFDDQHYVVIPIESVDSVDFTEVLEDSEDTIRISLDGTQTFVKYRGDIPTGVSSLSGRSDEYSHEEMMELLATSDWTSPDDG